MPSASEIMHDYYRGADFADDSISAVIECVSVEELPNRQGEPKQKLILTLVNHRRKVVLNKTTTDALIEGWGDDYEGWVGKTVVLRGIPMLVAGKLMPVIVGTPSTVQAHRQAE